MSAFTARLLKTRLGLIAKIMVLPLVICAVVGAESLNNLANRKSAGNSQDDETLNQTFRTHFIKMEEGNKFGGTITGIDAESGTTIGIAGLNVYVVRRSKIIHETKTNSDGEFEFADVEPGIYSFCVAGRNGFLAYGVYLVEPSPTSPADAVDVDLSDQEFEIHTSWPAAPLQVTAAVIPPEFRSLRQIMSNLLPSSISGSVGYGSDKSQINVEKSVVAGGHKINLSENGTLQGRLAAIAVNPDQPTNMRDLNVFLIQDDEIYARGTVDEDGKFQLLNIEPGVYGFAAAGKGGFAALSFQAVVATSAENDLPVDSEETRFTAIKVPFVADSLEVAVCPPEDISFLKAKVEELVDDAPPTDFGPAPFPGGFGGAAPAGFGPDGFVSAAPGGNRLLRWGLVGLLIWAALESGDDNNVEPPGPTSPIN